MRVEAIASLISVYLHLCKLSGRNQLLTAILFYNHTIKSLFERGHALNSQSYHLTLENMTFKQQQKIKSSIVDINNCLNEILLFFYSLNSEFHPGCRLIDIFSSHIFFHNANHNSNESKTAYCKKLDKIIFKLLSDLKSVIIATDASIKNNITTSIAHIHSFNNSLKKTLHHAVKITPIKAELFAIRYEINQAVQTQDIFCIIVITDTIYTAKKIIDSSIYPYQK